MALIQDHGEYHEEYVANDRRCACHDRVHRCSDCPFVTFDLNEWALHIINDNHLPGLPG